MNSLTSTAHGVAAGRAPRQVAGVLVVPRGAAGRAGRSSQPDAIRACRCGTADAAAGRCISVAPCLRELRGGRSRPGSTGSGALLVLGGRAALVFGIGKLPDRVAATRQPTRRGRRRRRRPADRSSRPPTASRERDACRRRSRRRRRRARRPPSRSPLPTGTGDLRGHRRGRRARGARATAVAGHAVVFKLVSTRGSACTWHVSRRTRRGQDDLGQRPDLVEPGLPAARCPTQTSSCVRADEPTTVVVGLERPALATTAARRPPPGPSRASTT